MLEAPRLDDEDKRLAALSSTGLLDTPLEQRFNRITRTAARLFKVPIATITLVDEHRQWFKSRFGLFVSETPRNISFCGDAIVSDDMLVIENALEDARFRDNPLVTGAPHIRFYAGRPLATPAGAKLGTLCLIDREPRTLSEEDRLALEDLAGWAEREINLSLERANMQARLVAVLGEIVRGVILLDARGRVSWVNKSMGQLLGLEPGTLTNAPAHQVFADKTIHDLQQIAPAPGAANHTEQLEVMLRHKDGRFLSMESTVVTSLIDDERYGVMLVKRPK